MGSPKDDSLTRRGFLASSASVSAALLAAGAEAQQKKPPAKPAAKPAPKPAPKPAAPSAAPPAAPVDPVSFAVIGLGPHGRDILASLSRVNGANIVAVCDKYPAFLNRGKQAAPKAEGLPDYRQVLERSDVQAVIVATPTHQHKDIVLAAIQAGKHVYCEAPMAHTVEDAKAIAQAGKASKQVFQVGLQYRGNEQHHHVHKFIHSAALGQVAGGRAQWHKKTSWRRPAPTPEREREINWRLVKATSPGLIGEVGIHSLDVAYWFLNKRPVSVTGFGALLQWQDGREVPDTVQCVIEYPGGLRFAYSATLANSYDGSYEVFFGSDAAVLLRDQRAWMFKEADAPLLGWEVYARKEPYGDETGIALVADASKQLKEGKIPGKEKQVLDPGKSPLFFSLDSFANCIREKKAPHCGPAEGYQATVTALKANEATLSGTKLEYQKEWFEL
jgi:predicted dehydrogenase